MYGSTSGAAAGSGGDEVQKLRNMTLVQSQQCQTNFSQNLTSLRKGLLR